MRRTLTAVLAATVALPITATQAPAQDRDYGYTPADDIPYHWSERRRGTDPYRPRIWDEFHEREARRRAEYYAESGRPPSPPHTPDRYITDWDAARGPGGGTYAEPGRPPDPPRSPDRYATEWGQPGGYGHAGDYGADMYGYGRPGPEYGRATYGPAPFADDRWAERPHYDRQFDRPNPPPGYEARGFRGGPDRGYDAGSRYTDRPWGGVDSGGYEMGYRDNRGFDPHARYPRADYEARHREMHAAMRNDAHQDRDFRRDFREDGRRGYYQDPSYVEMPGEQPRVRGDRRVPDMRTIRRAMRMIDTYDTDRDGRVTQEEVNSFRADRLGQFDADQDDALTLEEYEQLWLDATQPRVTRMFEGYDRDDDDRITVEEFSARTRDLVRMRDRDRDAALTGRDFGADEFRRPEVQAPLGDSPNQPARGRVEGDDDVSAYGPRPEVEAPLGDSPNEPAGPETYQEEVDPAEAQAGERTADEGATDEDDETLDTTQ